MTKILTFLVVILLSLIIAFPAQALTCRHYNGHTICIISINRSAKNHWEYRASISIDGAKTPVGVYDCRQRIWNQDNKNVRFEQDNVGKVVCSFFKKA